MTTNQQQQQQQEKEERTWNDDLENDYQRILSVGEECISATELKTLLLKKGRGSTSTLSSESTTASNRIILYDGFEPSGRMHIAQGVFKAMNVNKCTVPNETNSTFVFWVADWFALMNDKMGGDLEKIKIVGQYLIEVWTAAGMDLTNVVFKWASDEITINAHKYWPLLLDVARRFTITRIKKCCQIMGRLEGNLTSAQILYPLMQCTDVFFLNTDICQLGVDQRKVNMLAREYCDSAKRKVKPIILSHHMLYGLKAGQEKMSKSDPDSAIFMEDHTDDVERKIRNAYCPSVPAVTITTTTTTQQQSSDSNNDAGKESMQLVEDTLKNPCLDYIKNIIFSPPNSTYTSGDGVVYTNYQTVHDAFINGIISEDNLKTGLINELNLLLQPVRNHFTTNTNAKNLLNLVQEYKKESTPTKSTTTLTKETIRRLDLITLHKVKPNSHLVFMPLPIPQPTIQMIIDLSKQLRAGVPVPTAESEVSTSNINTNIVLYLQDWCAIVTNSCDGDIKVITAYYTIMLNALYAYDPKIMEHVTIIYQSEAILLDPSNYWINVINVGRFFPLNDIMAALHIKDDDNAGLVISQLMKIAGITSIEPVSIGMLVGYTNVQENGDDSIGNIQEQIIKLKSITELETILIQKYYSCERIQNLLQLPTIVEVKSTLIRLQPFRDSNAFITENDEYYIVDDPKIHGKSKIKKTFCEPCNINFNPCIALIDVLVLNNVTNNNDNNNSTTFTIIRSEENGGNKVYTTIDEIQNDFLLGETILHPGDVKSCITPYVIKLLETLSNSITKDKNAVNAGKTLKTFLKKKK